MNKKYKVLCNISVGHYKWTKGQVLEAGYKMSQLPIQYVEFWLSVNSIEEV